MFDFCTKLLYTSRMQTQITFENFSFFADNYAEELSINMPLSIDSPAEQFLPPLQLLEKQRQQEKERLEEAILVQFCEFLQFERANILSKTLKESIKEVCVGRLCQALGINCAYNFKNDFFNFFSCIMGEVISNKLGHNIEIDEYNLKFIKVENTNIIYSARTMIENPNLDQAFIDVYKLAHRFEHLILDLKRN